MENQKIANKQIGDIDTWLATREEFIKKVSTQMIEGKDFHIIQDRKSLAKGGAEKIASIFKWTAEFKKDTETLEMLGNPKGVLAYICTLKNHDFVGEGRGARSVVKDNGDINKAIKMAQKSAYIDAVLRSSGLSDIFTQDLEDMKGEDLASDLATPKQLDYIKDLMRERGIEKLGDIGIDKPQVMTKEWAGDAIDVLLTYKGKSQVENEASKLDSELDEIITGR